MIFHKGKEKKNNQRLLCRNRGWRVYWSLATLGFYYIIRPSRLYPSFSCRASQHRLLSYRRRSHPLSEQPHHRHSGEMAEQVHSPFHSDGLSHSFCSIFNWWVILIPLFFSFLLFFDGLQTEKAFLKQPKVFLWYVFSFFLFNLT